MAEPKKREVEVATLLQNRKVALLDDQATKKVAPFFHELLEEKWKDGKCTRQAGRLSVRVEGGTLLVTISCPTEGEQTTFPVTSLTSLVEDSEKILTEGKCLWVLTWDRRKKNKPEIESAIE